MSDKILHFVNRLDFRNAGDFTCCLPQYLLSLQHARKFRIMHHDIDAISWNHIRPDDVVILGAGGMLNVTESFNRNIIRLLDTCKNVIGYSVGFNETKGHHLETPIENQIGRFKSIAIRDFNHPSGLKYVPCPSVFFLDRLPSKDPPIKRKLGVVHHRDFPAKEFEDCKDAITNERSIWEVLTFIQECETVATTSYHGVYFSQLLGKKVVLDRSSDFSKKFKYFKHPPVVGRENLASAEPAPKNFRAECIVLNLDFIQTNIEPLLRDLGDEAKEDPNFSPERQALADLECKVANLNWRLTTLEKR